MKSSRPDNPLNLLLVIGLAIGGLVVSQLWYADPATVTEVEHTTPRLLFDTQVTAVLDRRCSNCHGVPEKTYRTLDSDPNSRVLLRWPVDAAGRIGTTELRDVAYERCRTVRVHGAKRLVPIDAQNPALASAILLAPLSETYAGTSVIHPPCFASPSDPDFVILRRWVEAELASAPAPSRELGTATERFFAEQVVPVLARKTCFGANCHGERAFNDLKLHPGVPLLEGRFTPDMHRSNRLSMLGRRTDQARMVHLSGDITQSRQLLKNIPIAQGGILHKGGNEFFDKGDPDYQILVRWLELEAAEAREHTRAPLGEQRGLVFVRRPRNTPQRYFEDDAFQPGGDLFWRNQGRETNLTAALHPDGPADIRTPDVSYDARRVVFAMRRTLTEPLNIWEIELDSLDARQLTFSADPTEHFQDPQYVPDPGDAQGERLDAEALVMVSNRAGEWATSSPEGILGEAESGDRWQITDLQLTEKPGTYDGRVLRIVRGTNYGQTRTIDRHDEGAITVDEPFDEPCDSTTHYMIEVEPRVAPSYDLYRMKLAAPDLERETFAQTLSRGTFGLGQIRRPSVRSSGEVMFTALRTGWQSDRPFFNGALFRTFHDGSNYHTHYGNRSVVPILADNRELPNGLEVRVGRDADSYWGGALIVSDHQFGPTIDPDNPLDNLDHPFAAGVPDHSLHQFFRGWVLLDDRVTMRGVSPGGTYRDPCPAPDGSILVAYARGPIDLADPEAAPDFDIIRMVADPSWQSVDGMKGGTLHREVLVGGTQTSELWPRPVVVRAVERLKKQPKWAVDLVGEPAGGLGSRGYAEGTPAHLMVSDLVVLDAFFEQNLPAGERQLRREQVRYARVIGAQPLTAGQTGPPRRFVVAEVPLEKDGSFQLAIPSEVAFDVQSLDADRMALGSPNRWLYVLPGEKHTLSIPQMLYAQTCAGCHGTFSGKRTNTFGRPDAITSASRTLAIWDDAKHETRPPVNYDVAGGRYRTEPFSVGFEEDIRPILDLHCVSCHSGAERAAGLDLTGTDAFGQLRRLVDHRQAMARRSFLAETLLGRELSAPRRLERSEPHPRDTPLPPAELHQVMRWIDLGAPRERVVLR